MSEFRRWYVPGGTYFFTVVTQGRLPVFQEPEAVRMLGRVMRDVKRKYPFQTVATVVLPDHLHCVWTLPQGDADFSGRWRRIKRAFSDHWVSVGGLEESRSASRIASGEHGVWQRRFWEHQIRDEGDLERHVDYVHYNPVKHGHAARPADWPWSSFLRHVRLGQYSPDGGRTQPAMPNVVPGE